MTAQAVDDVLTDSARQAAFSVYEDEGHMPAAKTAATSAAKAKSAAIHDQVLTAAKTWKDALVKKGQTQERTDLKDEVVQHVKDEEVGKKSVDAALKANSPETGMAKLGHFFDFMVPERGDAIKFKVTLEVPAGPGNVLLELSGDAERGTRERLVEHQPGGGKTISRDTNSLKIGCEIKVGYTGSFPGIKLSGALGFFMRSDAASTDMCMKAMSYGIYRFLTTAMPPLANLWGGSHNKARRDDRATRTIPTTISKDDVYRSELWAAMVEEQVFKKDKQARVDLGVSLNGGIEVNGGVAKAKGGLRGELMRSYDHQALKKSVDRHNAKGAPQKQVGHNTSLGDDTFDKDGARDRREAISGRTTGSFALEAETEVIIAGQTFVFGLKVKITPPDFELEISGGLKITTSDPAQAKTRLIAGIAGASQNGLKMIIGMIRNIVDQDHAVAGVLGNITDALTRTTGDVNNITNNVVGDSISKSYQVGTGQSDHVNQTINTGLGGKTGTDEATKAGAVQETLYKLSIVIGSSKFMVKVDEVQATKVQVGGGTGPRLNVEYEKSRRVGQIGVSNGKFHGELLGVSTKT